MSGGFCYTAFMSETIFTKIIRREIPATVVYEDEQSMAFLDVHPQSKGHVLLVPKEPCGRIQHVPDELLSRLILTSKALINAMIDGLGCDYVQVEMVGKGVPNHFHIHLIPRMNEDEVPESPYKSYEDTEADEYAQKISSALDA